MFMRLIKESTLSDEKMAFNFGPENPRPPTCSWTATVYVTRLSDVLYRHRIWWGFLVTG